MDLFSPTKQNTFVVIVTYNPDIRLCESINIIKNIVDNIVIIDNNSSIDVKLLVNTNYHFIKNNKNLGIAQALNTGAQYAINKGAKWLLMLDQDTIPRFDILDIFKTVYLLYPYKEYIGQIGVSVPQLYTRVSPFKEVNALITSGTLLSLAAFQEVGIFREDFFIDRVDFEYSLRLKIRKYVNLLSPEFAINHRLGQMKYKKIFLFTIKSTNHNSIRRYYMARNHVIISKLYFLHFPLWIFKKHFFMFQILLQMIIVDDHKLLKIKNSCKGFADGLFYKNIEFK
jgi:rhamnosyltransferase